MHVKSWIEPGKRDTVLHVGKDMDIRSLEEARDYIRRLPEEKRVHCIRVLVHNDQWLETPLVLGPEDSGTEEAPVIYQAAPGTKPRISGGTRITGWKEVSLNGMRAWKTLLPEAASGRHLFTQIFVNGHRASRPSLPDKGFYMFRDVPRKGEPQNHAGYYPGDIKEEWTGRKDIEITVYNFWTVSHYGVSRVDSKENTVYFDRPAFYTLDDEKRRNSSRYRVENVKEALRFPGQWYLNREEGELTYLPLPNETLISTEIIAPILDCIVSLEGDANPSEQIDNPGNLIEENLPSCRPESQKEIRDVTAKPVSNIHFSGLHFCHTEWSYPPDLSGSHFSLRAPGAIRMRCAQNCSVRLCEISCTAAYALEVDYGCLENTIVANYLHDLGAGGIKLKRLSGFSTVSDNVITHGGRRYPDSVGVAISQSNDNAVVHNLIYDLLYCGISCGGGLGFGPCRGQRNTIEYNHIHTLSQGLLSDMGGVYTLGASPGTTVSHNHIHDVRCYGYGGNGLYPDEGTSFIRYEGNVVYNTDSGNIHINYARDIVFKHNVLLFSRDTQITWGTPELFMPISMINNVIVWDTGSTVEGNWFRGLPKAKFSGNIWWNKAGTVDFKGLSWEHWQKRGFDSDGAAADPLIAFDSEGGLAVREDSPMRKAGIPFPDTRLMGPRRDVVATGKNPKEIRPVGPLVWTSIEPADAPVPKPGDKKSEAYHKIYTAYPDRTPCRVDIRAVFENAGDSAWKGTVRFYAAAGLEKPAEKTAELSLQPGEKAEIPLGVDIPGGTEEVIFRTESGEDGFYSSGISLGFRPTVEAPMLQDNIKAEEIESLLAGAPEISLLHPAGELGRFRVGISADRLAVHVKVRDSRIERSQPVYKGSMVDVFGIGTPSDNKGGQVAETFGQVFLVPPSGGEKARITDTTARDIEGVDISSRTVEGGYEISALIPMEILQISVVDGEFAFNAAIYTHVEGIPGPVRAHLFNERARNDIHAYGIMKLAK